MVTEHGDAFDHGMDNIQFQYWICNYTILLRVLALSIEVAKRLAMLLAAMMEG